MKFPFYNECPNCGHVPRDHTSDCGRFCPCPLSRAEVDQAITIQAAVEMALQRAK